MFTMDARCLNQLQWCRTLPGVGWILSVVIAQEIGDVGRFACPERLASYSGMTLQK